MQWMLHPEFTAESTIKKVVPGLRYVVFPQKKSHTEHGRVWQPGPSPVAVVQNDPTSTQP